MFYSNNQSSNLKKNNTDGLFPLLNWVHKKTQFIDSDKIFPTAYMLNRWISMGSKESCVIINETLNKWNNKSLIYQNVLDTAKFLRILIPNYKQKITYLKKESTNKSDKENLYLESLARECSQREIEENKTLLADLKKQYN